MNLQQQFDNLTNLFGPRNAIYISRDIRPLYLLDAVRRLNKMMRKHELNMDILGHALASVFAWAHCYAESFSNLPIVQMMCEKYPSDKCGYCGKQPCGCSTHDRPDITDSPISNIQMGWGVRDWCENSERTYGNINRARGYEYALLRLNEEVGEVASEYLSGIQDLSMDSTELRRNISREFADVFAWIFSISTMFHIDLEKCLSERYHGVHKRCGNRPCTCGSYHHNLARGHVTADTVVGS